MTIPDPVDPPVPVDPDPEPKDTGADDDGNGTSEGTDGYITCTSGTLSYVSTDVGAKTCYYHVENSSFGGNTATPSHTIRKRHKWYRDGVVQTPTKNNGTTTATSGTFDTDSNGQTDYLCVVDDNTYSWRARARDETDGGKDVNGILYYWKTASIAATSSTPVLPTVGAGTLEPTQAYIECYFYPNTLHSTATCQLQYKLTSSGTWNNLGSSAGTYGYSQQSIGRQLTGLSPETSYDVRLVITRNSVLNTSLTSATRTFSTPAGVPVVTTSAATSVSAGAELVDDDGSAKLNGNFDRNSQTDAQWRFAYGTAPSTYTSSTTWTSSTSEPETVDSTISSLTENTTYYFRLELRYNSGTQFVYGSELSFTVPLNPGEGADKEDFMLPIFYDAQVGVDLDIYFTLRDLSSSDNDQLYDSTAPTAAQTQVYQNGASGANAVNAPSKVATKLYKWTLDSTETTVDIIDAVISDGGLTFRDLHIQIRTRQLLSQIDLNAANMSGAVSALKATGVGAGHGIEAIGGTTGQDISGILGKHVLAFGSLTSYAGGPPPTLTLTDGFSATADMYNGDVIFVYSTTAGEGQSRVISDFTAGGVATLSSALNKALGTSPKYLILPGARALDGVQAALTSVPDDDSTMAVKIQFLFQRFAYKIKQSATAQTWYESDSETVYATRAVSDDGSEQDLAKLTDA